jgi:hypothetical protein
MQTTIVGTSSRSEPIVTTIEEPEPIRGGAELAIVHYTLLLPIKPMKTPIIVSSIQVEILGEHVTPKLVPLVLPNIRVGAKVTLINNVTHASKVFRSLDIVLKDTLVMERPDS